MLKERQEAFKFKFYDLGGSKVVLFYDCGLCQKQATGDTRSKFSYQSFQTFNRKERERQVPGQRSQPIHRFLVKISLFFWEVLFVY